MKCLNRAVLLVLALTLLAFCLRVYRVDAMSLWTDEGLSVYRAQSALLDNLSGRIVIQGVPTTDTHPPLYFLLLSAWRLLAGDTEFALRFLSVMAGTLIVPLGYVSGKRLFNREVGLWFAALLAASPFYWWYARDARMYTLLPMWALAGIYLIASGLQATPLSRKRLAGGVVCLMAAALTHYTGVLLVALLGGWLLAALWQRQRRWALIGLGAVALAAVPTIVFGIQRLTVADFQEYRAFQEMLFETWNNLSLGLSRVQMRPLEQLIIFPLLGLIGFIGLAWRRQWARLLLVAVWLFLPLLAFYLVSLIKPAYVNPRNLSLALPAYLLAVALGLTLLRRAAWPLAAIAFAVILIEFGAATYQQFTSPYLVKDDIRSLVQYLQAHYQPGDGVVLHDPIIGVTFNYYDHNSLSPEAIPHYGAYADAAQAIRDLEREAARYDRLWFIDRPGPVGFDDQPMLRWLAEHLYPLQSKGFNGNLTGAHVWLYQTRSPLFAALPTQADAAVAAHSDQVDLAGAALPRSAVPGDQILDIATYWRAANKPSDLTVLQELIDGRGNVWAQTKDSLWKYWPGDSWPADQLVEWQSRLRLPVGLPPQDYGVRLRLIDEKTGAPVSFDRADPQGNVFLGTVHVDRPVQPWTRTALQDVVPVDAALGDALEVWGLSLPTDIIRPGATTSLDLVWHVLRDLKEPHQFQLVLIGPNGQDLPAITGQLEAAGLPASEWRAGDVLRQNIILFVPPNARGGDYRLRLQVFDAAQQALLPQAADLGVLHVEEYPLTTSVPPLQIERHAQFAEPIELLGANLSRGPYQPGGQLDVDLVWRASDRPANDYTVFLQLLDANGSLAGQGDSDPVGGLRYTSSWRPGEVIVDQHTIALKPDLPPGAYTLYTGLYQRDTGDRVAVTVDGTTPPERWVKVGEIKIGP